MTTHTAPEHDTRDISPEDVLGDDPLQILTHARGPSGTVPFTEDFLTNGASGDHFGMTQNAGMGWNPVELLRKQFVILSTAGGLRQPDGTPIALGLHTGHFELSTMVEVAARELREQKAIPFDHGFPLRIWLPDRYGMKQPKWITGIEVIGEYKAGYWVERNWDEVARIRTTSVIDTVAVDATITEGDDKLVPIGGIAFAGVRGISKVEIQVDREGP